MTSYCSAAKGVLLDIEGTVCFKGAEIPGAAEAVARIREMGLQVCFLTNIDSRTTSTIKHELAALGLTVPEDEIFSPVSAALRYVSERSENRCHCLLSPELASSFAPFSTRDGKVDYVVVGDLRNIATYKVLNDAFRYIMAGAEIIALQKGRYFISAEGYNLDTGAFVQLFEYASERIARVMGKPSPDFFWAALGKMGLRPDEVLVVGDDVAADIAGAKGIGAQAVLVRTGKYGDETLARSPVRPDVVLDSIADLPGILRS